MSSTTKYEFPTNTSASFLIVDVGASAAAIVALCGLVGVNGPFMAVLATIVLGATYLIKGILSKARATPQPYQNAHARRLKRSLIILGGACGVVFGVIVLVDIGFAILIPISSIVFGIVTLMFGSGAVEDSSVAAYSDGSAPVDVFINMHTFIGVAVIILATLSAANIENDVTLNLVSLFCLAASSLASSVNLHRPFFSFMRGRL
jgi:hypothetical protein